MRIHTARVTAAMVSTESNSFPLDFHPASLAISSPASVLAQVAITSSLMQTGQWVKQVAGHSLPTCPHPPPTPERSECPHLVTPSKTRSTIKAEILSVTSPVVASFTGVLAKTVKISAVPPLLESREEQHHSLSGAKKPKGLRSVGVPASPLSPPPLPRLSPDPNLAPIQGIKFPTGAELRQGPDRGGIRPAGSFRQAKGCVVLPSGMKGSSHSPPQRSGLPRPGAPRGWPTQALLFLTCCLTGATLTRSGPCWIACGGFPHFIG